MERREGGSRRSGYVYIIANSLCHTAESAHCKEIILQLKKASPPLQKSIKINSISTFGQNV